MILRVSAALLAACLMPALGPAPALAKDPKVPPAKDASGAPVALVASGIDYTDAALTGRLARDGEGNIVGWDFVDNDIFPFSRDAASNALAKLLVANAGVKLVPVRVGEGDYRGVGGAAGFVSHTPVTVVAVTLSSGRKEDWDVFAQAAQHFRQLLFVVPAGDGTVLPYPGALKLDNVVSVAAATSKDETADVAMAAGADAALTPGGNGEAAVMAAAALASCHAGALGPGDGKTRKAALLAKVAKPRSASKVPAIERCP
jgi:hypothetical protein